MSELAYLFWLKRAAVEGSQLTHASRKRLYLKTGFAAILTIWIIAGILMLLAPTRYESKWSVILPGNGAGALVNLESLGQATSSSSSPYSSSAIDPRENYKAIANSELLLIRAAQMAKMPAGTIGKPKLKLPNQTGLMLFSINANDPKIAQAKAWALYRTLQVMLDELRSDEVKMRENGIRRGLSGFSNKVNSTQKAILGFQSERGLVSLDQFKELAITIERLRHNRVTLVSKVNGLSAKETALIRHLDTSPKLAADLLKLHNDKLIQEMVASLNTTKAQLHEMSAHYGTNHPQITTMKAQKNKLYQALNHHISSLLGRNSQKILALLTIDDIDGRSQLFEQLIAVRAEREGLEHELFRLDHEILAWEDRLESSNDDAALLEDLHREHQLATAILTSAIAKMDVSKADIYTAYPLLQLLSPPTLPTTSNKLTIILLMVAALSASFMSITGLCILWIRKPLLRKILTKNSSTEQ
ncbi:exopolysaccharide biosynthesis protein [Shewanella intestini]|uniref:Exopolysaccharide biosynthesis protein n=1 Tax=Shewanella intestini TaxID=2017544 RepID=A0ABS5HYH1_9GAMM|nr:exopolysaccharide biosynthesis protein [Shewanella intestini]MRG34613.1 exopolysaccharide biosynthesis protein [Shewanella sp. XMDDZSB0408]